MEHSHADLCVCVIVYHLWQKLCFSKAQIFTVWSFIKKKFSYPCFGCQQRDLWIPSQVENKREWQWDVGRTGALVVFREINAFTSCVGTHPGKVVESRCKVFFFPFKLGFFLHLRILPFGQNGCHVIPKNKIILIKPELYAILQENVHSDPAQSFFIIVWWMNEWSSDEHIVNLSEFVRHFCTRCLSC